jgi:hydroxypyruvate isomerase
VPRFSVNVSFTLTERPFLERFRQAAELGFRAVDIQFPYDEAPPEAVAAAVRDAGVEVVLLNLPAGDRAAGESGLAALPGREAEFRDGCAAALAYCRALGCRRVNVLAGIPAAGADPEACRVTLASNLAFAAEQCAAAGVTAMVEPINGRDVPGFFVQTAEAALEAIDRAGHPNLRLQLDLYHCQVMGDDPIATLERHLPRIAHVQFADAPGRHEPGTGEIDFPLVFAAIDATGYDGWVGAEYRPSGRIEDSLAWFRPWQAG